MYSRHNRRALATSQGQRDLYPNAACEMSHLAAAEEGDRSSVSCTARGEPLCEDFHKCVEKLESLMLKRRKDLFVIREVSKQLETFTSSTRKLVYPVLLGVSDSDTSFVADIAGIGTPEHCCCSAQQCFSHIGYFIVQIKILKVNESLLAM